MVNFPYHTELQKINMSIQKQIRQTLTFAVALATLSMVSIGCGEADSTNNHEVENSDPATSKIEVAKRTKTLKKIFRAAPSPMETARIIQKEGVSFNPENLCGVELASKDGLSSDYAISLGLLGADLSYASIYRKNSIALSYLEAVKTLSQELGVGSVLNNELIGRAEANRANRDSVVTLVSRAFYDLNEKLKSVGHEDLSGLVVASGWIEGLYLATRELEGSSDNYKTLIAEQKLILVDVMSLIESYKESPAIEGMIQQLQPVVTAFEGVTYGESAEITAKKKDGAIYIGGGKEYFADENTIQAITTAITTLRNNLIQ